MSTHEDAKNYPKESDCPLPPAPLPSPELVPIRGRESSAKTERTTERIAAQKRNNATMRRRKRMDEKKRKEEEEEASQDNEKKHMVRGRSSL